MDDQNDTAAVADEETTAGPAIEAGVHGSAFKAVAEFTEAYAKPTVTGVADPVSGATALIKIDKAGVTAVPASIFDDYLDGPRRREGTATLTDLGSFISHVNRFKDDDSVVFADNNRSTPKLTAVLDYHMAGAENAPRFGGHRSLFKFPLSDEWQGWNANNKTALSMKDFARFLEDHIIDVMPPEMIRLSEQSTEYLSRIGALDKIAHPAQLIELAHNFEVFEQSNAGEAQNLSSGEMAQRLEVIHVDSRGQPLAIPKAFVIGIPVFKNGEVWQILAQLRYRKDGGTIVFFYELWRLDLVFDTAFDDAAKQVETQTGLPVLLGSPE